MPKFSRVSHARLYTCHIKLQVLFEHIVRYADCTILCGHRDEEDQNKTPLKWPNSKHNRQPSMAVDVAPWPIPKGWGDLNSKDVWKRDVAWKERVKFYEFAGIVRYEAQKLGFKVRWGGDWDGDGDYTDQTFDDLTHWELFD